MNNRNFWKGFLSGLLCVMICMSLFIVVTGKTGVVNWGLIKGTGTQQSVFGNPIEKKAAEIEAYINKYFLDDIDSEKMEDGISAGIVAGLDDRYAAYYNKEDYKELQESTAGSFCGIGAYVTQNATSGAITVVQPMKDSPAEEAGIKAGDVITAVDNRSTQNQDLNQVTAWMKGEEGSEVKLKIVRSGQPEAMEFTMIRQMIESQTVSSRMLPSKIGYVAVSAFESVTTEQFTDAVNRLEQQGEKGLIIDLRNNGGGLLSAAVDMLDRLLPKELLVYTKNKNGEGSKFYAKDNNEVTKPMVILVNENSASASEVFSGAMQDYGRAKLVGTTTFGKGIVQTLFKLSDGTALKLTTEKYYTPKGRNIHGMGLTPEVKVDIDKKTYKLQDGTEVDNQMKAGIDTLLSEIK